MGEDWLDMLVTPGVDWRVMGSDLDSIAEKPESHCTAIKSIAVQYSGSDGIF